MSTKLEQLRRAAHPLSGITPLLERIPMIKGDKGDPGEAIVGPQGPQGEPGKTPIKGEDYFTQQEIDELVALIQSRVKDGAKGEAGRNGTTPVKGLDYWSKKDQEAIIRDVLSRIPKTKETPVDHQAIAEGAVKKVLATKPIKIEHIADLDKTLAGLTGYLKRGGFRGGGSTVLAGSNVTVTNNADGSQTVSSSGGSGFTALTATETPNGSITVFTFAAVTAQPSYLVVDNVWMKATSKAGTVNWTWNAGGKKATLTIAPTDDIFGIV